MNYTRAARSILATAELPGKPGLPGSTHHQAESGVDLDDIDLNLLRIFHQLMIERRVSSVAESLGMSQPAVSSALK